MSELKPEQLQPCPFCGCAELDIDDFGFGPASGESVIVDYIIQCKDCNAMLMQPTKEGTVAAWNTRPDPWISVEDGLPEEDKYVLILTSYGKSATAWLQKGHDPTYGWIDWMRPEHSYGSVTHWMPIPELPKGGE